jgi:threonine/homoserine/homoserine lactone efflux protein
MQSQLAALILASVVIMGSPGPSTISATAVGASFGIRRALAYVLGLIVGTSVVLLMVSAGAIVLLPAIPHAATVLGIISTVYIGFLAFKIATARPLDARHKPTTAPNFAGGFLLAIANPKAWLAIAAVFGGTTVIAGDPSLDAITKTALLTAMIVLIHLVWLTLGTSLSRLLHDPVSARIINVSLATALVIVTTIALIR